MTSPTDLPQPQSLRKNVTYTLPLTKLTDGSGFYTAHILAGNNSLNMVVSTRQESTLIASMACNSTLGCTGSNYPQPPGMNMTPTVYGHGVVGINSYPMSFKAYNENFYMPNGDVLATNASFYLIENST